MTKRVGLKKGLEGLIPTNFDTGEDQPVKEKIVEKIVEKKVETIVKITDIEPNKKQPRKHFKEDALVELADSIKQYGVVQPLVVQRKDDYYQIIAGERRWRAAKLAGLKEIPVVIKDYSDEQVMEIALIENIQREDLNPIEEALAYRQLLQEYKMTQDELAEKIGKGRSSISNKMRLLELTEEVQNMLIDEKLTKGHGKVLLAIEDAETQIMIAEKAFDEDLSVSATDKLVKSILNPKEKKEKETYDDGFIYEKIENEFKELIGNNVTIKRKSKEKGKIEIDYYSNDDLERIMELMKKIKE